MLQSLDESDGELFSDGEFDEPQRREQYDGCWATQASCTQGSVLLPTKDDRQQCSGGPCSSQGASSSSLSTCPMGVATPLSHDSARRCLEGAVAECLQSSNASVGAVASVQQSPELQSPKRRRLSAKQPDMESASIVRTSVARVAKYFVDSTTEDSDLHGDWTNLREFLRHKFTMGREPSASGLAGAAEPAACREVRDKRRSEWAGMSGQARMRFLRELLESGDIPAHLQVVAEEKLRNASSNLHEGRMARGVQSTSVLLTWNGDWGLINDIPEGSHSWDLGMLVPILRKHPVVQFLFAQLQELNIRAAEMMGVQKHACCLELCTSSLQARSIRVHCHAFWASNGGIRVHSLTQWTFGKSCPYRRFDLPGTKARGRSVSASHFAGLYYVCAPKLGSLLHAATHLPNKDFVISPEWINTLFQLRKLDPVTAKSELAKCRKDVARHVANVDQSIALERELHEETQLAEVRRQLAGAMLPRKHVDIVDNVWLKEQAEIRRRQRFLVLDGKTKCGKSMFALSLRGPSKTLAINCGTSLQEPDMRHFVRGVHECVVFEEAHAMMVIRCKQLFQAAPEMLSLGTSQTQCHAYRVCVHGVLLVVTSNVWQEELHDLSAGDQEWLRENSYVVQVTEPLWAQ